MMNAAPTRPITTLLNKLYKLYVVTYNINCSLVDSRHKFSSMVECRIISSALNTQTLYRAGECRSRDSRSALSTRGCHASPHSRKRLTTSRERRMVMRSLIGVFRAPRTILISVVRSTSTAGPARVKSRKLYPRLSASSRSDIPPAPDAFHPGKHAKTSQRRFRHGTRTRYLK
jgi:hypothetical protein